MKRLFYSLAAGCVFALSTLMMIEFPVLSSIAFVASLQRLFSVLLMPGFFVGYGISGNIHVARSAVVTSANFVFYSALAYLTLALWSMRKSTSERRQISANGPPKASG